MQTLWGTSAALGLAVLLTACAPPDSSTPASTNPPSSPSSIPPASSPPPMPTPPALYHVQLNWTAPSTRADGSPLPLSELSGYRIYYLLEGTDSSKDTTVAINGASTTTLSLTLTTAGSYTFAITAVDQNGVESSLSSAVSVPIN